MGSWRVRRDKIPQGTAVADKINQLFLYLSSWDWKEKPEIRQERSMLATGKSNWGCYKTIECYISGWCIPQTSWEPTLMSSLLLPPSLVRSSGYMFNIIFSQLIAKAIFTVYLPCSDITLGGSVVKGLGDRFRRPQIVHEWATKENRQDLERGGLYIW